MQRRALLGRVAGLAGSLLVAVFLAESVLRVFFPQPTAERLLAGRPAMYRESEIFPWELVPGFEGRHQEREFDVSIRLNSRGYRNPEFETRKGDRLRVLVVGDSYTFGHGVEGHEAYPRVAERALAEKLPDERVEVVNAGYAGARHPDTYYLYMKREGLELDPDVVVVGFYIGNDIDGGDARQREWSKVDEGGLPLAVRSTTARVEDGHWMTLNRSLRWRVPIVRNSHFAQLLFSAAHILRSAGVSGVREQDLWVYRPVYEPETAKRVETVQTLFGAMAELCASHDSRLVVVLIPTREQVHPGTFPVPREMDLGKPQRIFTHYFKRQATLFLDLLPVLRGADAGDLLYFETDPHWTPQGHAIAGRALADYLVEQAALSGRQDDGTPAAARARE